MPKLLCRCDEVLRFGEIPCPIEWRVISDVDFDRFSGQVDAENIYRATQMMLKCPRCGRLWVFWDKESDTPSEYVPGTADNK
jgi:hypothetical protein